MDDEFRTNKNKKMKKLLELQGEREEEQNSFADTLTQNFSPATESKLLTSSSTYVVFVSDNFHLLLLKERRLPRDTTREEQTDEPKDVDHRGVRGRGWIRSESKIRQEGEMREMGGWRRRESVSRSARENESEVS